MSRSSPCELRCKTATGLKRLQYEVATVLLVEFKQNDQLHQHVDVAGVGTQLKSRVPLSDYMMVLEYMYLSQYWTSA